MKVADVFMHTIRPQLDVTGIAVSEDPERFWKRRFEEVRQLFFKALTLKAQMESAPDIYQTKYSISGAPVNPARAEEVYETNGPQEVICGVMPIVVKRATPDSEERLVSPAIVISQPQRKNATKGEAPR